MVRPPVAGWQTARVQTIGLVGGMSWESSAVYYQALNEGVEQRVGGLSSARTMLASVDFAEVTALQEQERWDDVAAILTSAAQGVERAGADFLLLCTTTFHRVADQVEAAVGIPLLHLADVVAEACKAQQVTSVGFLGTEFAMSRSFFTDRLAQHGLEVHVPDPRHHAALNAIIYDELVHGRVLDSSRRTVVGLIEELWDAGAGGLVLGCTELELLVRQPDSELPLFPCTTLHVAAALDRALG
nr:amino acid racemase [Nocardioides lijunqiniae]